MNDLMVKGQQIMVLMKAKRKILGTILVVIVIVGLVWWAKSTIDRAADYDKLKAEYDTLQAAATANASELEKLEETKKRLEYEEQQVTLLKESTNALKEQIAGLNAEKEDLNNQLEELLHIQESVPKITRSELETQISSLSELVTKKFWYRNATQKGSDKTWLWGWTMPFSDISLVATYDGYITTSIDFKEIKVDLNERTKVITITMPKSKIFDHNIPQETINVIQHKDNLFNKVTFNDYNQFIAAEKLVMEEIAIEQGLLTDADKEAQEIIKAFLEKIPGMDAYTLKFEQTK